MMWVPPQVSPDRENGERNDCGTQKREQSLFQGKKFANGDQFFWGQKLSFLLRSLVEI
jgi:hypothetical protein